MKRKFTCIVCPIGCQITAEYDGKKIKNIEGNFCKRGKQFVEKEIVNPTRILTTTISIDSKKFKRLPVRSNKPAPKNKIKELVNITKENKAMAPVKAGEIIIKNICSGIDIIASMSIDE